MSDCEELFISLKMPVDTVKELFFLQNYHGLKEEREIWHNPPRIIRLLVLFEGQVSPLYKALPERRPCSKVIFSGVPLVTFARTICLSSI